MPSKLSYSTLAIECGDTMISIPRREYFDIEAQLMAEDPSVDDDGTAGLSGSDITPHVYEGGFKTWECSIDLANYVSTALSDREGNHVRHVIEVNMSYICVSS